jgi:hypothetical protein
MIHNCEFVGVLIVTGNLDVETFLLYVFFGLCLTVVYERVTVSPQFEKRVPYVLS